MHFCLKIMTAILAVLSTASILQAESTAIAQPNIILIFVDDMGYGDPGCYGGSLVPTPHIDRLTQNGIRFTQGYSVSSVCGPSRVGLLTGMQPSRLGVYWNPDMGRVKIPKGHPSLGEAIKGAGYTTGMIGKWNLNHPKQDNLTAGEHFDHTYSLMVWECNYWPEADGKYHGVEDRNYGSNKLNGTWGPLKPGDEYITDRLSRNACEFITQEADDPFFLYLAYNAPHSPLQGKAAHLDQLMHIESEPLKLYASMVLAIEEGVGQILQTLEDTGLRENTCILFVSDNGPAKTNFKGLLPDWPRNLQLGSTGGLNGAKKEFLEGGIRVPFILNWPAAIKGTQEYHHPVTTLDLYPTLCGIAGVQLPAGIQLDGIDLMPNLIPVAQAPKERTLLWFAGPSGAIREGDWKLVFDPENGKRLYNLRLDPYETKDLSVINTQIARSLWANIIAWGKSIPPPVTPRKNLKK